MDCIFAHLHSLLGQSRRHAWRDQASECKKYNLFSHISLFVLISKQYPKFLKLNRNNI